MRVAAIFGPGASAKDLKPFQRTAEAAWVTGLPATSGDADAVLILGGDGTIHRYLADLVKLQLPVLVVPCGSGNDFARALGLRSARDSLAAWRGFVSDGGNLRTIDLGFITEMDGKGAGGAPFDFAQGGSAAHEHYFCTVGGVGLDSEVARRANQLPAWLRGSGGYALCLLPALLKFAPIAMKITTAGQVPTAQAKPIFLAAFANAAAYGGGMRIAPRARIDDGKLDACVIQDVGKLKLLCLFPTVYFGRHLKVAEVEYFQAEGIRLETETPCDVYADGEFVCHTPIEVGVARQALRAIVHPTRFAF